MFIFFYELIILTNGGLWCQKQAIIKYYTTTDVLTNQLKNIYFLQFLK